MFPSSFRSYGPGRRKDSAIRTLVAETLVLAKTHGCVEKIESELEEELRRESGGQASDPLSKWRRKGDKALKSKYALLTVALFCVTDCALVLGELILDLHRVKDTLETTERTMDEFKETLHAAYPANIPDVTIDINDVFDLITRSRILWVNTSSQAHDHHNLTFPTTTTNNNSLPFSSSSSSFSSSPNSRIHHPSGGHLETGSLLTSSSTTARSVVSVRRRRRSRGRGVEEETEYIVVVQEEATSGKRMSVNESGAPAHGHGAHGKGDKRLHSLEEDIAHAFHLTSVTLLAILMFESLLKAFCAGLTFFKRRLETFDLFIVVVSFIVDVVFMQILPRFKIQDFVFILAFLLPWRVIRVVNSLVVAVQDHEHFRLKMVYSRKKKIQNSLRETEVKLQLFRVMWISSVY
ncbi:uncharacterized protein LOC143286331 [Babylonia areolata]|uniref:uncharacterized protein LOC143286331 n=1 Tax=Babylonia areolata TaxID=304850 RepID=UPI003FCF07CF